MVQSTTTPLALISFANSAVLHAASAVISRLLDERPAASVMRQGI
jgi:hypothetical protein